MNELTIIISIGLGLLGLVLGSFAGASVWRLRARQLVSDQKNGESVDAKELKRLKPLAKAKLSKDRSRCLDCGYELKWYDLIPLVSWLSLRGRCRHCHRRIGSFEPLIELGTAAFFVGSYLLWPYPLDSSLEIGRLVIWLLSGVGLAILFSYDAKWFLLPDGINYALIGLGAASALLTIAGAADTFSAITNVAGSVALTGGLYAILYYVSRGKWVGFGDVKLSIGLGLLLADWQLAFLSIFAANLIGCLLVIVPLIRGSLKPTSQVPFGPLLILGTIIAQLAGPAILDWYIITLL